MEPPRAERRPLADSVKWPAWPRKIVEHPATSYAAILLLQLKMIWGMWWYKDLTTGDTSSYFLGAVSWLREGITSFVWSPLYCSFLGELLHISSDAYTVVILHRMLIVLVLAVLVLALMRRLLPSALVAWLAAAWWVLLPIDFNSLYEVHLFAVIPLVLVPLAMLWRPGVWGRGIAAAILVADGLLVRNENLAAAGVLVALSLGYEFWHSRKVAGELWELKGTLLAYGIPMLCTILLASFFFFHRVPYDSWALVRAKHNVNVCQVYAAGYQQRASDFTLSPWTDCGILMKRDFGSDDMSMIEALRANPSAMLAHFVWNIRLLPSGLQVLLFNFRSGSANPDYAPTMQSDLILIPSIVACAIVGLGAYFFFLERKRWMETWRNHFAARGMLEARFCAWVALGCVCMAVGGAILTNRPRPSYLFILGITIRAVVGLCLYVLIRQWPKLRIATVAAAALAIGAVLALPSLYQHSPSPRPLLKAYRRLKPYEKFFHEPKHLLISTEFSFELSSYAGRCSCPAKQYGEVRGQVGPARSLAQVLEERGATLFLLDEPALADPVAREFLGSAKQLHWDIMEEQHSGTENWAVLHRTLP